MADIMSFFYNTSLGRVLLKPLISPAVSKLFAALLRTKFSMRFADRFAHSNNIDLDEYDLSGIDNFNDFFCRPIKKGMRPVDADPDALISPCDGLLSSYDIKDGLVVPVKQSRFDIASLLRSKKLAARFEGGKCLVFRLCVNNYHRYCYFDGGKKSKNRYIPGVLHTVRPVALREVPVFIENSREYTIIKTDNFGLAVQMEVGAILIGKIVNYDQEAIVKRGAEKGRFEYGGSTIIVLLEKDKAELLPEFINEPEEVEVMYGQRIGTRMKK